MVLILFLVPRNNKINRVKVNNTNFILVNLYEKPRELFKNKEFLLDEPEVEQLLEYCEKLQDELVDLKLDQKQNKQLIMLDMLKEIVKACSETEKQQKEFLRFGLEPPDFEESISNLKRFLIVRCRENGIWID